MELKIRKATLDDLDRLAEIEKEAFPPAEAAPKKSYKWRLDHFSEFAFVGESNGIIVGAVIGRPTKEKTIVDDLYEPQELPIGDSYAILSVLTAMDYRKKGVAEKIMNYAISEMKKKNMETLCLTCKEHLIHYYAKFGFKELGVSKSTHGGVIWYDMNMNI